MPDSPRTSEKTFRIGVAPPTNELAGGISWLAVTPFVLHGLAQICHKRASDEKKPASLTFVLGEHHPLYEAVPEPPLFTLDRRDHYCFYVRVHDLPEFLHRVAPVLERFTEGTDSPDVQEATALLGDVGVSATG